MQDRTSRTTFDFNAGQLLTALNTNKIFINFSGKSLIKFGRLTSKCKKKTKKPKFGAF